MSAPREEPSAAATDAERLADLRARAELLAEENRRLRESYGRLRRTRHRRTALGLGALGLVALAGAALFPDVRVVLVALGATGLFGGLLTWYLTPERFVAAEVGERVYAALAGNEARIAAELGLSEARVYVPLPDDPDREAALYVPQAVETAGESALATDASRVPDPAELADAFVLPGDAGRRGLALEPTGGPLLAELRESLPGGLGDEPRALVDQLADGLHEGFELVDSAHPEVDAADRRAALAVSGSAFGAVDRFDHPVGSLFAVGLAAGLGEPVRLEAARTPDGRGEYLLTARWATDGEGTAGDAAGGEETTGEAANDDVADGGTADGRAG